ncbi:homeobox protein H2.0-like [Tetranychus urticae]|uniref:Homeobox domain-containing protein n=1 Tax=Tetranychus urticae TaxID=32264 RepID=T1KUI0_TETUR|nr:homeobox protein H2.0-like [Tetranychus urticae]
MDPRSLPCGYNFCMDAILGNVNNSPYSSFNSSHSSPYYQQLAPNVTFFTNHYPVCHPAQEAIQTCPQKVSKKKSGTRAVFTSAQRQNLESVFLRQQYINKIDRKKLAEALNLAEPQVKVWFQNRRSKMRREHSKAMGEVPREQFRFNSSNSLYNMHDDDDSRRSASSSLEIDLSQCVDEYLNNENNLN